MAADCYPAPSGGRRAHDLVTQGGRTIAHHQTKESCLEHLRRRYAPSAPKNTDEPPSLPDQPTDTVP